MKENKYDDPVFFEKYSQMLRSQRGLSGAEEWRELQKLLPGFAGRRVLDLPGMRDELRRPMMLLVSAEKQ